MSLMTSSASPQSNEVNYVAVMNNKWKLESELDCQALRTANAVRGIYNIDVRVGQ